MHSSLKIFVVTWKGGKKISVGIGCVRGDGGGGTNTNFILTSHGLEESTRKHRRYPFHL